VKSKPKVYTFFEPIDKWGSSKLLLDLWVENWSKHGFEPIVLNESDAKSHPYYKEYDKIIKSNHKKITGKDIMTGWGSYVYFCFIRHLAFANKMTDEICIAMDYDIYNINYDQEVLNKNKIMVFNGQNPCCLSGNKHLFLKLCLLMSKFTEENIDEYKLSFDNCVEKRAFHDFGWVRCTLGLKNDLSKKLKRITIFGENKIQGSGVDEEKPLIHVSFFWLQKHLEDKSPTVTDLSVDERLKLRYTLAKEKIK